MYLFGHNIVKHNHINKPIYYTWWKIKLPKKLGKYLWNKPTPKWLHKCNFDGYIKNQCSICGKYKNN